MADAPVLKWFGAAPDTDLNYKRQQMHSNKTHGKEIHKKLAFSGINESKLRCFCLLREVGVISNKIVWHDGHSSKWVLDVINSLYSNFWHTSYPKKVCKICTNFTNLLWVGSMSENNYITNIRDGDFILGMHTELMKHYQLTQGSIYVVCELYTKNRCL